MNARAANIHWLSESEIRNGRMRRTKRIARSSKMFCQSRKYSKRMSFALGIRMGGHWEGTVSYRIGLGLASFRGHSNP